MYIFYFYLYLICYIYISLYLNFIFVLNMLIFFVIVSFFSVFFFVIFHVIFFFVSIHVVTVLWSVFFLSVFLLLYQNCDWSTALTSQPRPLVGYTMRDIRYKWNEGPNSVGVSNEVSLPQFKVLGHRQRAMEISLTTGIKLLKDKN